MTQPLSYRANGKLLLSGEYFVLYGANALALPLVYGQQMDVQEGPSDSIEWISRYLGREWFSAKFDGQLNVLHTTSPERAAVVTRILRTALQMAHKHPQELLGARLLHQLEFDPSWGWGSSSTLIANLAKWLGVDAFELSRRTLGGSSYDVACANAQGPIFYRLVDDKPLVETAAFNPPFADQLYFVFLGQKQDSRQAVAHATAQGRPSDAAINEISAISEEMATCKDLTQFAWLMERHEAIVSAHIGIDPVKPRLFAHFNGHVKSLGAWGGDFIMAASNLGDEETFRFFSTKGYHTLFRFHQIVLNKA